MRVAEAREFLVVEAADQVAVEVAERGHGGRLGRATAFHEPAADALAAARVRVEHLPDLHEARLLVRALRADVRLLGRQRHPRRPALGLEVRGRSATARLPMPFPIWSGSPISTSRP